MAIAVGDRVRPRLSSSTLGAFQLNPQPPVLAVVTRVIALEGPNDIVATVAENGITWAMNASTLAPEGVDESSLDQITAPDTATREAFIDKVVVGVKSDGTTEYGAEYIGVVIDVYVVNGTAAVLVKTQTGLFYELPATRVVVVPFR
jgi:hypothetical protein